MWIEILYALGVLAGSIVTPFAGVWIEIDVALLSGNNGNNVTPFAGVWIEILNWQRKKSLRS